MKRRRFFRVTQCERCNGTSPAHLIMGCYRCLTWLCRDCLNKHTKGMIALDKTRKEQQQ